MNIEKVIGASRGWIEREGHSILNEYRELLSLPNHAADLPNIEKNCEFISQMFAKRGFEMRFLWLDGAPPICLLYTSPSPRDQRGSRMPSSA